MNALRLLIALVAIFANFDNTVLAQKQVGEVLDTLNITTVALRDGYPYNKVTTCEIVAVTLAEFRADKKMYTYLDILRRAEKFSLEVVPTPLTERVVAKIHLEGESRIFLGTLPFTNAYDPTLWIYVATETTSPADEVIYEIDEYAAVGSFEDYEGIAHSRAVFFTTKEQHLITGDYDPDARRYLPKRLIFLRPKA